MDLFTVMLIGFASWVVLLVLVLAMCRMASRADAEAEAPIAQGSNFVFEQLALR